MAIPDIQRTLADSQSDNRGRNFTQAKIPRFSAGQHCPQILSATAMNRLVDAVNALMTLQINPPSSGSFSITSANAVADFQPTQDQIDALNVQVQTLTAQVAYIWAYLFNAVPIISFDTSAVAPITQAAVLPADIEAFS
jgi:hypothetical protein